jgi:hypothetical protein
MTMPGFTDLQVIRARGRHRGVSIPGHEALALYRPRTVDIRMSRRPERSQGK